VAVTGWSRANTRRAIATTNKRRGPERAVTRKPRAPTCGYDTRKFLIEVWTLIGEPCGRYLAPILCSCTGRHLEHAGPEADDSSVTNVPGKRQST
jgi:hypothetical protein